MDWLYLIGRIMFALVFLVSGFGHLTQTQGLAQYAGSKGVPAPKAMVLLTGVMTLAGGLSILLGLWMEIGTWLLIFFLIPVAIKIHDFWAEADPMQKQVQQAHFLKNISMAGGALILYWAIQSFGYGPFTLGGPM